MKVRPRVVLLAETSVNSYAALKWLRELGLDDTESCVLLNNMSGSEGEKIVELAARRCYKSFKEKLNSNVTKIRSKSAEFHQNVISSGHGSVLEHCWTTWAFENVSRVFTHELVRHRVGVAFSQESLRYVRLDKLNYWLPPEAGEYQIDGKMTDQFEDMSDLQRDLAEGLDLDSRDFATKKRLTSLMRRVAPIGLATGIVFSANIRALRHIIAVRTALSAEIEMRTVFSEVGRICKDRWPMLFFDAVEVKNEEGPNTWKFECKKV